MNCTLERTVHFALTACTQWTARMAAYIESSYKYDGGSVRHLPLGAIYTQYGQKLYKKTKYISDVSLMYPV